MANYKKEAAIVAAAEAAGMAAANDFTPTPMIVGSPSTSLGNDVDYSKKTYFVESGVCGFAWISVKPGNSRIANYLKRTGKGRTDSYAGGVTVWVSEFGQSMERKAAYAGAYARVLYENGIEKAYAMSRMD